jgi:hypothetical protein
MSKPSLTNQLEEMYARAEAAYKQGGEMAPKVAVSKTKMLLGICLFVLLGLFLAFNGQIILGGVALLLAFCLGCLTVWKLTAKKKNDI